MQCFNFCHKKKTKSYGHERKDVITEAVLHICPVSKYKIETERKKERKKKTMGKSSSG
jgi:hypothetical protein